MANPRLLIDTSILIEHLRKKNRTKSILYNIVDHYDLYIATIIEFELFMGATDERKLHDIREVLTWCTSLPLTSAVAEQAGSIHQKLKVANQLIEVRDLLIGATAIVHDLPLMTLNSKHFERVTTVRLVSPPF